MAANKAVWGIDLGQCALKAICLRPSDDKERVEIVDHVYVEHSRILSHPDADRPALVAEAMRKFTENHDLGKETLVVSVPGQHTLARFTKLPPLENKRKIPELVRFEAQQQIPFDMEEVMWDYQVFEDAKAGEIEVGIFAMRRDLLREQLQYLSNLNLEPAIVQSAPLALYNALRFDGVCGDEPICILDIGTQNTDLIVVVEGRSLWTRNIPIGGNAFTEVLLNTFKLSFGKAERLKRDAQKHKYARQIFQAMRPVFNDLVAEVQRSIGFFTSSRRGVRLGKIVAMGNAFRLPGMVKFVQQNLGMDVIRPTSFNKLSAAGAPNAEQLQDNLLSYGVAYGLALQGLGLSQINSNLLPTEIAKQVVWRRKTPWFYGSAAALALAALLIWGRNLADARSVSGGRGDDPAPIFTVQYDQNDKEQKNPLPDPAALRVLDGGFTAESPIGKAKEIGEVENHLNQIVGMIRSKNQPLIDQARELIDLELNEKVWIHVLHMIHSALPKPDADMAKAIEQGPEAVKTLIQSNPTKYERSKRGEVYILSLRPEYSPDVMSAFKDKGADKSGGGIGFGMSPQTGIDGMSTESSAPAIQNQPGFLMYMRFRCPHQDQYQYVNKSFLTSLRAAEVPGVAYVADVRAKRENQLKDIGPQSGGGLAGAGRTPSPMAGGPSMANTGVSEQVAVDPVTGELMREDWEYSGVVAVVLGDRPKTPPAGDAVPSDGSETPPPEPGVADPGAADPFGGGG